MRITCPACAAAYDVPDARIVPNRAVRCARCGTDWTPLSVLAVPEPSVAPPAAPPAAVPEAARPETAVPEAPLPPPALSAAALLARAIPPKLPDDGAVMLGPRSRGWGLAVAWAASVSLLLLLAAAAVHWRTDVMAAWPPSERLYAALGLSAPPVH